MRGCDGMKVYHTKECVCKEGKRVRGGEREGTEAVKRDGS